MLIGLFISNRQKNEKGCRNKIEDCKITITDECKEIENECKELIKISILGAVSLMISSYLVSLF